MPRFRAVGPDGKTYEAEAPDETTFRAHVLRASRPEGYSSGLGDGGLGRTLEHGFTLGFSDEAKGAGAGVGSAIVGALRRGDLSGLGQDYIQGYRKAADRDRAVRAQFAAEHPIGAGATEFVAGLGSLRAAPKAPQMTYRRAAAQGAGVGGAYSAGSNNGDLGERAQAGAVGAGIGATGGVVLKGAGDVGGEAVRMMRRGRLTPEQRAARIVDRGLRQGGVDVDDLASRQRALGAGPAEETLAEIGGAATRAQARAVANVEGPGRQIAEDALEKRAQGIARRTITETARGMPKARKGMTIEDAEDVLRAARSGEAVEGYRAAYAAPLSQDVARQTVVPLMQRGSKDALQSAARQLESETLRVRSRIADLETQGMNVKEPEIAALTQDLADIARAQTQLRMLANGQDPGEISVRAMDYYQRGLRQMAEAAGMRTPEGSTLATARDAFNNLADRVAPAFGAARTRYGEATKALEMMDLGRTLLSRSDGEVARATRNLTVEQRDALMTGVLDEIQTRVQRNDTAFVAAFKRNKVWQGVLKEALGDRAAKRILTRVYREAAMSAFRNYVLGGSRTAPLADDIKMLTEGESELKFLAEFIEQGGNISSFGLRKLTEWWRRQAANAGIRDPRVNEALARLLYSKATGGAKGGVARAQAQIKALPKYARGRTAAGSAVSLAAGPVAPMVTERDGR